MSKHLNFEEIRQMVIANLESQGEETKFLVALMNKYPPPTPEEWAACVSAAAVQAGTAEPDPMTCLREYEEILYRGRIKSPLGELIADMMKVSPEVGVPQECAVEMCKRFLLSPKFHEITPDDYLDWL